MSGFTPSATEALLEEGVTKQETKSESKPWSHKLLGYLIGALGFAPFIMVMVFANPEIGVWVGTGKFVLTKIANKTLRQMPLTHLCVLTPMYVTQISIIFLRRLPL